MLQTRWRMKIARRELRTTYRKVRRAKRKKAAIMLQAHYKSRLARRFVQTLKLDNAATSIQKMWRGRMGRKLAKEWLTLNNSAVKIQRQWRGKVARVTFKAIKKHNRLINASILPYQKLIRNYQARVFTEDAREARRIRAEYTYYSTICLIKCVRLERDREIIRCIEADISNELGCMQSIFIHWCSAPGSADTNLKMSGVQWAK